MNNTVVLGQVWDARTSAPDGKENLVIENAMAPQHLRVPVGTTVTFTNPATNKAAHHAVSFWEAEFDTGQLLPGQLFKHTFAERGEFFYNDPPFPQNTGQVVVY